MSKKSKIDLFQRIFSWLNAGGSRIIEKIDPNWPAKKEVIAKINDQLTKHHPDKLFLDCFSTQHLSTLSLEHLQKIREELDKLI